MELLKTRFPSGFTGLLTAHKGHFLKLVYGAFTRARVILGIFTQNMFVLGKF
jgi:hypothetical protein